MSEVTIAHFLVLGFVLFAIGVVGVLSRRSVLVVLMSIELILNAVNLNLVAFSSHWEHVGAVAPHSGRVFALVVVVVAAAEVAVGLAIVVTLYRSRGTVDVDEIDLLKW